MFWRMCLHTHSKSFRIGLARICRLFFFLLFLLGSSTLSDDVRNYCTRLAYHYHQIRCLHSLSTEYDKRTHTHKHRADQIYQHSTRDLFINFSIFAYLFRFIKLDGHHLAVTPNNPKIHSFRVVSANDAHCMGLPPTSTPTKTLIANDNGGTIDATGGTTNNSSSECGGKVGGTKITKPILMCFICKLSFGNTKSFGLHANTEHTLNLQESEKTLLSREYSSAIIQRNIDEKPQISFLQPLDTAAPVRNALECDALLFIEIHSHSFAFIVSSKFGRIGNIQFKYIIIICN